MSSQKLTHFHISLIPGNSPAPAAGCVVRLRISKCRQTGSVATVKLPVRLREESRDAGRSQSRAICGEPRVVTLKPSRHIRPVIEATVISNSVASHSMFGHAPLRLQRNLAIHQPTTVTNESVVHTRTLTADGHDAIKVTSMVRPTQNQRPTLQRGIVTPHSAIVAVSPRSVTVPNNMMLLSVALGNAAKQLAKHKQVYKWAAERVLNSMDIQ